jgi:hypothetical protein
MSEYAARQLHSGSKDGPVVTNRAQAVAIGLNDKPKGGKGFKHHHKAAGEAHAKGDMAAARHHVGHMFASLKTGG